MVGVAEAALNTTRLNLGYTKVAAPVSGRVSRYLVTVGNLIQSVDPMYAYFDVDERSVQPVRQWLRQGKAESAPDTGLPVALGLATEEGFPHQGTINFVDNQVNPKTGTLHVRGVFPNKDEVPSGHGDLSVAWVERPGTSPTASRPDRKLEKRFPKGLRYAIVYDTAPFVRESVNEVFHTLRNAVILVAVVVLLFLQDWKSLLLPAIDRQQEGASRFDAAVEAARVRLRPILMTSFAFILGVTLFGIFLTPVFFYVIRRISGPLSPAVQPAHEAHPAKDAAPSSEAIHRPDRG